MPDFSQVTNLAVYTTAMTLAIVASLETLLCVEATDQLDPQKRVTPTDRELKAQGLGNIISGLIGGLPITQVIVRSSANIQSGGRTKLSAILHGVLLLVAVVAAADAAQPDPAGDAGGDPAHGRLQAGQAGALRARCTGWGWAQFVPFMVTVVGILATDLLVGIGLGMAVAVFLILVTNYRNPYFLDMKAHRPGDVVRLALSEDVSFLNRAAILRTLNGIPDGTRGRDRRPALGAHRLRRVRDPQGLRADRTAPRHRPHHQGALRAQAQDGRPAGSGPRHPARAEARRATIRGRRSRSPSSSRGHHAHTDQGHPDPR